MELLKILGCARFPEILKNFSERQILWSLCSVVFPVLTLKFPIQTSLSVAPELPVFWVHMKDDQISHPSDERMTCGQRVDDRNDVWMTATACRWCGDSIYVIPEVIHDVISQVSQNLVSAPRRPHEISAPKMFAFKEHNCYTALLKRTTTQKCWVYRTRKYTSQSATQRWKTIVSQQSPSALPTVQKFKFRNLDHWK